MNTVQTETLLIKGQKKGAGQLQLAWRRFCRNKAALVSLIVIVVIIQPPTPEWGNMLSEGKNFITSFWPMMFWPGLMVAICLLCFNLVGDGLRDALDPRMKR